MQEQSLINRGLDQQEAQIVVFVSRKRIADITTIAHSTRMPINRCGLIIAELVRKGILRRSISSTGIPMYSLNPYFNNLLQISEHDKGNAPFNKKLFPVAHHTLKLQK